MEIADLIREDLCCVEMMSKNKDDAIIEMAQFIKKSPKLDNIPTKTIIDALREREDLGSTGFGDSLAIPHSKLDNIDDFVVALMISKKGIDFDSVDGKKVHIFFVIIAPADKPNFYIKLLASISRAIKHKTVKKEMIKSTSATQLYETFLMHTEPNKIVKKEDSKNLKLLVLILYANDYLDDILQYFIEIGITGSTVIDSVGMGGILTKVPLFASFIDFLGSNKNYSKTILSVVEEDVVETVVEGVEDLLGDLDKRSGAMIFTLDVGFAKGSMENR